MGLGLSQRLPAPAELVSPKGGKTNPSILRPLSLLSPLSLSDDSKFNENIVEINVQCRESARVPYTDRPPGRSTLRPRGKVFVQGHRTLESREPGGKPFIHPLSALGKLLR